MNRALIGRIATAATALVAAVVVVMSGSSAPTSADGAGHAGGAVSSVSTAASSSVKSEARAVAQVARTATEQPVKYVALGSSYAAGPGATPNVGELCLRGDNSYPRAVAAARELTLVDVTCSGAMVANILDVPQRPAADRPQIEAVTPDTDLVTVTIGGNDISYVGRVIAMSCANSVPELARTVAARGCSAGRDPAPEPAPDAYARVERSMVAVVDAVRARAPHAIVVLVDYPAVVSVDEAPCPQLPLTPEQVVETQRVADGLAGATARAGATSGALVVTASKASATHTVCSTSPWVRGFALPIPYHPNAAGKSAVAQLVLDGLGNRIR